MLVKNVSMGNMFDNELTGAEEHNHNTVHFKSPQCNTCTDVNGCCCMAEYRFFLNVASEDIN